MDFVQEQVKNHEMFDFLESLTSFMEEEDAKSLNITQDETFKITNIQQAGYFVKKLLEIKKDNDEIKALAKKEKERVLEQINQWEAKQINNNKFLEDRYFNLLSNFAENEIKTSGKKTVKTPYGKITLKKQQDEYIYDDDKILEALQKNNSLSKYIKTSYSVNKKDLKSEGQAIDGKLIVDSITIDGISIVSRPEVLVVSE